MRLIDADALPRQKMLEACGNGKYEDVDIVHGVDVDAAPTIDPVKHGRWIRWVQNRDEWPAAMCSECQEKVDADNEGQYTNYCPNCGARMDGGSHEDD